MIVSVGDLITNGSSAGKVLARVARDPNWKCAGVKIANVALDQFGGNVGMTQVIPDYLLGSWRRIVVGEPTPVLGSGGALVETFQWSPNYARLRRIVTRAEAAA